MKKVNLLIVLGMVTGAAFAQDTLTISKNDLLQKVTENNLQIKVAEKSFQSAKADYRQSNALFLPNINVSHTGISTTNPLMAFGSKLNQEILTASDFNPALLNNPEKTQNFATKIEVQQPLFNLDGLIFLFSIKILSYFTLSKFSFSFFNLFNLNCDSSNFCFSTKSCF